MFLFIDSKNPLLDAELVIPCGHTFCGFCVNILRSKNSGKEIKCEKCREPVKAFCKNHLANNFLSMVDGECNWCKGNSLYIRQEITLKFAKKLKSVVSSAVSLLNARKETTTKRHARWQTCCVDVESSIQE